jgi:RNA polymerase sigma factor (sigma-70 family)
MMQENVYKQNNQVSNTFDGNSLTDEQLITLYLNTKADVYFEKLHSRYVKTVYRKCMAMVKDGNEAQDLTQEIFLKLLFRLNTFDGKSKFCTWLYTVAYHQCVDSLRANNKSGHLSYHDFPEGYLFKNVRHDQNEESNREEIMEAALVQLSGKERQILLRKYQDNLAVETLAQEYQVSQTAIKMRLLRSRQTLRKIYMGMLDKQDSSHFS